MRNFEDLLFDILLPIFIFELFVLFQIVVIGAFLGW